MFGNKSLDSFDFEILYHVYTHVSVNELVFREQKNYFFFLDKIKFYLLPILDIYAYCLMPNHIHFLVTFKNKNEVLQNLKLENPDFEDDKTHQILMKPFSNLLNSYAKAYNKIYSRKGSLFLDYLKRIRVDNEAYLLNIFNYIHNNPKNHGFVENPEDWKFSSYNSYLNQDKFSLVNRRFMMSYFDSLEDFIAFHKKDIYLDEF